LSYADCIAVVAVTDSSTDSVPAFLDALRGATEAPLDIVVAHYGSDPVRAAPPELGVRVVRAGDVGYAAAANLGVRETTAELVLIADADLRWEPGALDALIAATRRWPRAASFGPLVRTSTGAVLATARAVPSLGSGIGHAVFGWWWPGNPWTARYRRTREQPVERTAGWLADTCLLLRRDAFDAVGGFRADGLVYLEDLDLGERLTQAGWQNVYVPSAVVTGRSRQRSRTDRSGLTADRHRSAYRYVAARYSGWRWWPLRVVLRAGLGVRAGFARLRRDP
jgi:N-acetylglucosaminyl-diphospho-decaprenol L-rhamnosyltransferase